MATGKFLNDGSVNSIGVGSLATGTDYFPVHDASAAELKKIQAADVLKRLLSTADVSWMSAFANIAAVDSTNDKFLVWDASGSAVKTLTATEILDRLLTTLDISSLSTLSALSDTDADNDKLLVWDATSTAQFKATSIGNLSRRLWAGVRTDNTTTPVTLTTAQSGQQFTNTGATLAITYNLPAAASGLRYSFVRVATYDIVLDANGSDTINGTATYTLASTGRVDVECFAAGAWIVISRSTYAENDGVINVVNYGAGLGSSDDSAAIQEAFDDALAGNKVVYFPRGTYYIASTVNVKAAFYGDGINNNAGSWIKNNGITSGAMFEMDVTDANFGKFGPRGVFHGVGFDGAIGGVWQNGVTGIYTAPEAADWLYHCTFRDISMFNLDYGWDVEGFTLRFDNCYTFESRYAGLRVRLGNALTVTGGRYSPHSSGGLAPDGGWGIVVAVGTNADTADSVVIEGVTIETSAPSVSNGLRIPEGVKSVSISAYFEGFEGDNSTTTYIADIGGVASDGSSAATNTTNSAVVDVRFAATLVTGGAINDYDSQKLGNRVRLGNILFADLSGMQLSSGRLDISQYVRGLRLPVGKFKSGGAIDPSGYVIDESQRVGRPTTNFFVSGAGACRGASAITSSHASVTYAVETTAANTRNGVSSLALTMAGSSAGVEYGRIVIKPLAQSRIQALLDGVTGNKILVVAGWIKWPSSNDYATWSAWPAVRLEYYANSVLQVSGRQSFGYDTNKITAAAGYWNRFVIVHDVTGSAPYTNFGLAVYPYQQTTFVAPTAAHTCYIGDDLIWSVQPGDIWAVLNGEVMPDPAAGRAVGTALHLPGSALSTGDAAPTVNTVLWQRGDRIVYTTPSAGGAEGSICTSSGTLGSSVGTWRDINSIA